MLQWNRWSQVNCSEWVQISQEPPISPVLWHFRKLEAQRCNTSSDTQAQRCNMFRSRSSQGDLFVFDQIVTLLPIMGKISFSEDLIRKAFFCIRLKISNTQVFFKIDLERHRWTCSLHFWSIRPNWPCILLNKNIIYVTEVNQDQLHGVNQFELNRTKPGEAWWGPTDTIFGS